MDLDPSLSAFPDDDERRRRLAAAAGGVPAPAPVALPAAPVAPAAPPPPLVPSARTVASAFDAPLAAPSAPAALATPAPDFTGGAGGMGGVPRQPAAPRPLPFNAIPGLETYDPAKPMDQQDDHTLGRLPPGAPRLPGYVHQDAGLDLGGNSLTQPAPIPGLPAPAAPAPAATPSATAKPTHYTQGEDGSVQFDPTNLSGGLLHAYRDGLIDDDKFNTLLPKAQAAEAAVKEQARIARENPASWKAFASGAAKGVGFLAAAAPGAAAGTEIGAFGGPFAEVTIPAAALIGGLITGTAGSHAVDAVTKELGKHSETIQSFVDASALHPNYDAAGGLVAFAGGLPKVASTALAKGASALAGEGTGVASRVMRGAAENYANSGGVVQTAKNLAQDASIRAASGATTGQVATALGARVGGAAAGMVAIDTAIKEGSKALGFSDEGQTLSGAAQAALIGAFTAGHGIKVEGYNHQQVGDIAARARARENAGLGPEEALSAAEIAARYPNADSIQTHALARPLSPKEQEVFKATEAALTAALSRGQTATNDTKITARQATTGGRPYGVTAAEVNHPSGPDSPRTDSGSVPPNGSEPRSLEGRAAEDSPAPSPSSDQPASPESLTRSDSPAPENKSSPASTAPAAPGQAQSAPAQRDDNTNALEGMVRARDSYQRLLDGNRVSPEAVDGTKAMVDLLSQQIEAARKAPAQVAPGEPGPDAPARATLATPPTDTLAPAGIAPEVAPPPAAEQSPRPNSSLSSARETVDSTSPATANSDVSPGRPPTTFENIQGNKLDARRTAFHPDSGTLGIPRDQMPQVRAEHRGALANFFKARGIDWQNEDVLPGTLKPSQADFNPAKVEKARGWVGESDRRILVSSDNHVVDGHHQYLARLQDHPNEPMPVVRLNAPARDILSQVHEFPSAGMEKAPDVDGAPPATGRASAPVSPELLSLQEHADAHPAEHFKAGQKIVRDGRPGIIERIDGDKATVSLHRTEKQIGVRQRNVPLTSLEALPGARPRLAPSHADAIRAALAADRPVHAEAADKHDLIAPAHYAREGDRYVPSTVPSGAESAVEPLNRLVARQQAGEALSNGLLSQAKAHRKEIAKLRAKEAGQNPAPSAPKADTPAPATPPTPSAVRPRIEVPAQKGDTPKEIKARAWIADQRAAGKDYPKPDAVIRATGVGSDRAKTLIAEQAAAEQTAAQAAKSATPEQPAAATTTTERQPSTDSGQKAKQIVDRLTAKLRQDGHLSDADRQNLQAWQKVLDADLNRQALGKNPQPTTEAGKAAQKAIQRYNAAKEAGAKLSASDHAAWSNNLSVLESDFTKQRLALDAGGQAPATPPAKTSASKSPRLPVSTERIVTPAKTGENERMTAAREWIADQRAEGKEPTAYEVARATRLSSDQAKPILAEHLALEDSARKALDAAYRHIAANVDTLEALGVKEIQYGETRAASGVEMGEDGTLHIAPSKLARSMETVRANQEALGIRSTPEDYLTQTFAHEAVHAADFAVARAKGQTMEQRYDALPEEALPAGWETAGREAYGPKNWDPLPTWARKAEFVRQVVEGKWTGRISEQLYKFIRQALDYLKRVGGFRNTDPRFRAHVEEVERRIESARVSGPSKTARSFKMPHAATGAPDVLDHIAEQGGMLSPAKAKLRPSFTKYAGDYDGAPDLKGFYHHAVFGQGKLMPDQMAETLRDNYGVGDGSVDGMWKAVQQAKDLRATVSQDQGKQATLAKQAARFDRDALTPATAKGKTEVNTANLAVGDKVQVGNQTLTVTGIDPDTMDLELEDHSKYGVQTVADNTALYVEKIEPANADDAPDAALAAPSPERYRDTGTVSLFDEDNDAFALRAEPATEAERVARAKEAAATVRLSDLPRLRSGEKGTADLFQGQDQPFNLAGETAIDHGARQAEIERAAQATAEAQATQNREQRTLFAGAPEPEPAQRTPDPTRAPSVSELVKEATSPDATQRKRFAEYGTVSPEQAVALKASTGLDLSGYRRNLDNSTVRHILREHGDPQAETARGNLPLYKDDLARLTQWIKQPDASVLAGKNSRGQDVILHAKRINGHVIIAEEVRDARGVLSLSTLYKKSAPPLASGPGGKPDAALLQSTAQATLDQVARDFKFRHGQAGEAGGQSLGAGAPEPADEPGIIDRLRKKATAFQVRKAMDDQLSAGFDANRTLAEVAGGQAHTSIRQDIPGDLDRQAAGALVEAGYDPAKLRADLATVQASPNGKLAAKYAPIYQRALDQLPRLREATAGYRQLDAREDADAEAAGLPPQWQARAKHLYGDPTSPESTLPINTGFGTTKGFQTAAEAIGAGVDPRSVDLADLARRRVSRNQQLINEHQWQKELFSLHAADGQPILGEPVEVGSKLEADGSVSSTQKVPKGYVAVQAGGSLLTVHQDFAPLFKAFYNPSAIRQSPVGRAVLKAVAISRKYSLVLDTFHVGRVMFKELTTTGKVGYDKGLSILEHSPADLQRAQDAGDLTKAEADFAREHRPAAMELIAAGLNVGKMADNLGATVHVNVPGLSHLTDWTFNKLSRGAMLQSGLVALDRNLKRFPDRSRAENVRQTAKEMNEAFGNLGTQGPIKSQTMQDVSKMAFLAPNWTVSQLLNQFRGVGQLGRAAYEALRGNGVRVGNAGQAMAVGILGLAVANQILNLATRGKPTWENEEEGHKFDAWLPGGPHGRGFFFSPFELPAEFFHALHKYVHGGESAVDAVTHIASNKLSGPARGVKDLVTGEDWKGEPYGSMGERLTAATADTLPSPIPLGAFLQKDPQSPVGYSLNQQKGSVAKQGLAMIGMKVDAAPSARGQMFKLAEQFRAQPLPEGHHAASAYATLRRALDNADESGAEAEVRRLVGSGKSISQVEHALGLRGTPGKDALKVAPELFTGKRETEHKMLASLTPEQKKVYAKSQQDRLENATLLAKITERYRKERGKR